MQPILVTTGEPAGIGPDLCLQIAHEQLLVNDTALAKQPILFLADCDMMQARAQQLGLPITVNRLTIAAGNHPNHLPHYSHQPNTINVWHQPLPIPCQAGTLDSRNAPYILHCLDLATDACMQGQAQAMVTAPVHKGIINDAGFSFTGHTEYLQHRCRSHHVVMLLACDAMRVALATTHLPLHQVANTITRESLIATLTTLHTELNSRFGVAKPHIYVCGLNPHAGESGHLGEEEITIIEPTLAQLRQQGMQLTGPLPADTIFNADYLQDADCVLAMYHDQGLPVLKYAGFGTAVNITLGLPIIRTSVDHGTAVDIAGTGTASKDSLLAALQQSIHMSQHTHS